MRRAVIEPDFYGLYLGILVNQVLSQLDMLLAGLKRTLQHPNFRFCCHDPVATGLLVRALVKHKYRCLRVYTSQLSEIISRDVMMTDPEVVRVSRDLSAMLDDESGVTMEEMVGIRWRISEWLRRKTEEKREGEQVEERLLRRSQVKEFVDWYYHENNLHVTEALVATTSEAILSQCTSLALELMRFACNQLHESAQKTVG
ncbi:hypothetical protein SY88_13540 [Clostridiales bacterium PH28_bin88]|nr:hypothetical protein SY88_13540 [Clostridiales bacterium PH28_bin88]